MARTRGRRLVQRGVAIKLADQGQVTRVLLAKPRGLTGAVATVAYEDEVSIRKPAYQARQQQPRNVRWGLMAHAMHAIRLGGRYKATKIGSAQGRVVNGHLTSIEMTTHLCPQR
jgi:hypothetical protein